MREYISELTYSHAQLIAYRRAQDSLRRYAIQTQNESALSSAIGAISGISGVMGFFVKSVSFNGVSAFIGYCYAACSYLNSQYRETLKVTSINGCDYLQDIQDLMDDGKWKTVKIRVPMTEVIEDGKRVNFVSGFGSLLSFQTSTGKWIDMA